jgi:hypothetical protein
MLFARIIPAPTWAAQMHRVPQKKAQQLHFG